MKIFITFVGINIFFVLLFTSFLHAQQRPLPSESPQLIRAGTIHTELGVAHFRKQLFPLSGLDGNLTKLGILHFGFSYDGAVEMQFDGTLLDLLDVRNRYPAFNSNIATSSSTTGDIGDFTLWTKVLLANEYTSGVGIALRFGVQLPNASNESGLGIDELNFYSSFLFQKHFYGMEWTVNFGLGVLGNPAELSEQHDVHLYAIKNRTPISENIFLALETAGRFGHRGIGVEHLANGKMGIEILHNNLNFLLNGVLNFSPIDNAAGIECIVGYNFEIIHTER